MSGGQEGEKPGRGCRPQTWKSQENAPLEGTLWLHDTGDFRAQECSP